MIWQTFILSAFVFSGILLATSCNNQNPSKLEQAANSTKEQLGKNLLAAIQEHGTAGAVEFCNTRAITLTDSLGKSLHVFVKRVSDKPRNPANAANSDEQAYIEVLKDELAQGKALQPKVSKINGKLVGYYPILTNAMCLQCHGTPDKTIQAETLHKINQLYPHDKATGYGDNEVRGLFVVSMDK